MLQENSKKNQFFIRLLQCFILIQPLLDTYFFYANSKLKKLFVFSIPTLLRFGLIALIVFLFGNSVSANHGVDILNIFVCMH